VSVDPEDFKDKPERCEECGRMNVYRAYPAWQMKVCEECQSREEPDALTVERERLGNENALLLEIDRVRRAKYEVLLARIRETFADAEAWIAETDALFARKDSA
jgi:hypothetical protein